MRLRVLPVGVVLAAAIFPVTAALAQTAHHRPAASPPKASVADDLADLAAAERRAVEAAQPVEIAAAGRTLSARLLRELATIRLIEGKFPAAVELLERSLALSESPQANLELASLLIRAGRPGEAAAVAAKVTASDPQSAMAWTVQGTALRSAGDDKAAAEAFRRSLALHPDASIAFALGSTLLASHDKPGADKVFNQILLASGGDPVWHVAVGDAYRDAGYLDQAIDQFQSAIARDPRAPHAEFFLGLTYLQKNDWGPNSRSFDHLRVATRLNPTEYVSNFYLGAIESTDGTDLASSNRHLHAAADADPSQPEVWLYLGLNANREKNTTAAKEYLERSIHLTGADEARNNYQVRRAYFALGRLLIAEGKREEGSEMLTRYRRVEQAAVAQVGSAIAQASGGSDQSHLAVELSSSSAADTAKPAQVTVRTATPQLSPEQQERLRASEAELRRLLASSYNDLGTAEARQQEYPEALAHFQQAEQWDIPGAMLLHNLGVAAFRTENYTEADRALTLYLDQSPPQSDERSRMMLAYSQFSLGRFSQAAHSFAAAKESVLQDPRAAYSWAFSLARSGQQQQANQIADELVKRDLPVDVLGLVCHLYVDTEDYEQSASCYRKAAAQDPSMKLAHYQIGEALIRLDRPAEAIPELRKELELSAGNPNVESSLAFALLQTSQKDEARALLAKVTNTAPEQAEAQYQYGKLLLDDGKPNDAIAHLEAAEKLDPEKDYVHYQLQSAYRRVGNTEAAGREAAAFREIKARHREAATTPSKTDSARP